MVIKIRSRGEARNADDDDVEGEEGEEGEGEQGGPAREELRCSER